MPQGVAIREVAPDSPADKARLQVDAVITQVNGKPVTTPAEFYEAAKATAARPDRETSRAASIMSHWT